MLHFGAVTPIMEMSHRRLETAVWWPGRGRTREGIQGLQHLEEELWAQVRLPGERARWEQRDGDRVKVGDRKECGREKDEERRRSTQ